MAVESKMKNKSLLKKIGQGLLILIITLMAFKFIMWNFWKLERAAKLARGIVNSPPAVNVALWEKSTGSPLYRKSFAYNPQGNYYISNHFDITPYIGDNLNVTLAINGQNAQSLLLKRFKTFNVVTVKGQHFVFTTAACGIREFVQLQKTLPSIISPVEKGRREFIENK